MQNWTKMPLAIITVIAITLGSPIATAAQAPHYDLLLKGGHVIDPANHIDEVRDVAVFQGKIAAVGKNIPADQAGKVVDVSKLYVTPGLIDIHFHVGHGGAPLNWFSPDARAHFLPLGIPADLALQSGVTTIVDAGTSGAETFLQEKEEVIDRAKVRVLAFLNIVANGMNGGLEKPPTTGRRSLWTRRTRFGLRSTVPSNAAPLPMFRSCSIFSHGRNELMLT